MHQRPPSAPGIAHQGHRPTRHLRPLARLTLPSGLAAACLAAAAQTLPQPAQVDSCMACHGASSRIAGSRVPLLDGQPAPYLAAQLRAFRAGGRKNEAMAAIAQQLSDTDIGALAAWWSARAPGASAAVDGRVATRMRWPQDFPQGFGLYERVDDEAGKTVQLRYANTTAWRAAASGAPLPPGSVLVVATHAAVEDLASGLPQRDSRGRLVPGAVRVYAGMEAQPSWGDTIPALLRNGDWHYALFDAERRPREPANPADCLACHRPQAASGFVFTLPALREAARR